MMKNFVFSFFIRELRVKKIQNQKLILHSVFTVKLVDYKIKVPSLYITNIAEQIEITFDASLEPYVK